MIVVALSPADAPGLALRVLAILGGAVVAGLLASFLVKFLVRRVSSRPMPVWSVRLVRLLGAVLGGWLVWLWVFGPGGPGIGGPGGGHRGGGKDGEKEARKDEKEEEKDKKEPRKDADKEPPKKEPIQIALLGSSPLEEMFGKGFDVKKCYRVEGGPPKAVYDLPGLKKEVGQRLAKATGVQVILYRDSPDEDNEFFKDLRRWLLDEKLYQAPEKLNRPAPR